VDQRTRIHGPARNSGWAFRRIAMPIGGAAAGFGPLPSRVEHPRGCSAGCSSLPLLQLSAAPGRRAVYGRLAFSGRDGHLLTEQLVPGSRVFRRNIAVVMGMT
jgi:hypothetical protein